MESSAGHFSTRQIYATWHNDSRKKCEVMSILTSIDGFRLIAERSTHYAGQRGPFWTADGKEWREVWLDENPPAAVKIAILRHDFTEPLWAVATWEQYKQTDWNGKLTGLWRKMPALMLSKVAEALGLRRAFPQELSGLYTKEEMDQAGNDQPPVESKVEKPKPEPTQEDGESHPDEPTQGSLRDGWDYETEGEFNSLLFTTLYNLFKETGRKDWKELFAVDSDKWKGKHNTDPASTVLPKFKAYIDQMKGIVEKAKAKANAPKEEVPPPADDAYAGAPAAGDTAEEPDYESPEYEAQAKTALGRSLDRWDRFYRSEGKGDAEVRASVLGLRDQTIKDMRLKEKCLHPSQKNMMLANELTRKANEQRIPE
jgi:phage recombination protein Bet